MRKFEEPPKKIAEYSEWLSNFQGCEMDDQIEIPGMDLFNCKNKIDFIDYPQKNKSGL